MASTRSLSVTAPTGTSRGGRSTATRARLLRWARDVVDRGWCSRLEGDRVELMCSQADLARRLGYSPTSGGVSKRLAALEAFGVVVSRDPVVFDLAALRAFTDHHRDQQRQAPSRPSPLNPEPSDQWPAGDPLVPAYDTATGTGNVPSPVPVTSPDRLACTVRLLHHVCTAGRIDLIDEVLVCLPQLLGDVTRAEDRATRASPVPAPLPRVLPHALTSSPTSSPTSSLPPQPSCSTEPGSPSTATAAFLSAPEPSAPFSPYPPAPPPALPESRSPAPPSRPARGTTPSAASVERLRLLAPLLEDCRRLGLPGIGSPAGLLDALDGCTVEEVRLGVELIRRQLAGNVVLRSPVGLLAHLARSGELALLTQVPLLPADTAVAGHLADPGTVRTPSDEDEGTWLARIASLMRENPEPPATR